VITRFDREFHQSDFDKFKLCPRMFYYREVLGIDSERTSEAALAGTALHATVLKAHTDNIWTEEVLFALWREEFERELAKTLALGIEVPQGTVDREAYRSMLVGYVSKPWNREAEILLAEKEFFFEIKPGTRTYQFAGRIDQLLRVRTELLVPDFPAFRDVPRSTVIIHRDLKTGQRKGTSPFELMLNDQISIYAYALKFGVFDLDGDGVCEAYLDILPDSHALYFLHDHIPYKRPPKDRSVRGPAMYLTERPLGRLEKIPRELMPTCTSIRRGDYPREGAARGFCEKYCPVRSYCESDLVDEFT
jgi:hypothetical protein